MTRRGLLSELAGAITALVLIHSMAWAQSAPLPVPPDIQAIRDTQLHTNALLLYLRIAGLMWIVLEWIAAILLWKGYRALTTLTFRPPESAHDRTH